MLRFKFKQSYLAVFLLIGFLNSKALGLTNPLPGRSGSDRIYYTQLGKARIFFYMTPEKEALARQLIKDVNDKMALTIDVTSPPCPVSEVSAMATKFADPIGYDTQNRPKYADPVGQEILNKYASNVKKIVENSFGITLEGLSREMSLNLNHDALKIHQDHFTTQYAYLSQLPLPIERYNLFQDLTLIDWQMAQGTFSATMVQDGEKGDRFLMVLFPGEVVGKVYTEPMVYHGPNVVPSYPGPITFSPHTAVAPIQLNANWTVGSWRGSRVSTSTRGVVRETAVDKLCEKAVYLPVNRPIVGQDTNGKSYYHYSNGVLLKESSKLPSTNIRSAVYRLPDQENVSIYEKNLQECQRAYAPLIEELGIKGSIDKVLQLVKRDSGFSRFSKIDLGIAPGNQILIINKSHLPEGYQPFTLAEDCTIDGMPWIHMYHFPKNMAMLVSEGMLTKMAFTPVEELLYREHKSDAKDSSAWKLRQKIISEIEIIVLKMNKEC